MDSEGLSQAPEFGCRVGPIAKGRYRIMHTSSLKHMARLVETHLAPADTLEVIDIGSQDVNGSYRPIFTRPGWSYRGVDLVTGPTSTSSCPILTGCRSPAVDRRRDQRSSIRAHRIFLDHIPRNGSRAQARGKNVFDCTLARAEHRYPVDCWRFYPDGFRALACFGHINLVEVSTDWEPDAAEDSAAWGDTVGVFKNDTLGWSRMLGLEITLRCLRAWARSSPH